MRERRWLLLALYGILLATAVSDALKATRPKFKIATTSTSTSTTEEPETKEISEDEAETTTTAVDANATTGHTLTGIPQIDYIWDPNLPRELNGYNLSDYPFYNSIPGDIDFKCDGLHDGFYASVPHKCQVYHHCLYGTRYDFLCANFTAFDQKTFICHFVSEIDCANSKNYWHRNDALYKATTTNPPPTPSTTTTTSTAAPITPADRGRDRDPPRRRRPIMRRPAYDYYEDEYYDDDFDRGRPRGYNRRDYDDYDDRKYRRDRFRDRDGDIRERHRDYRDRDREIPRERYPLRGLRRDPLRSSRDPLEEDIKPRSRDTVGDELKTAIIRDQDSSRTRDVEDRVREGEERRYSDKRIRYDYDEKETTPVSSPLANNRNADSLIKPAAHPTSVYSRPRMPPKIRRPVPLSEQDKYAYKAPTTTQATIEESRKKTEDTFEDEYYEDELEEIRPRWQMRSRPSYRDRDRDFYDSRYRDRDRPYRSRYRDEEDEVRPARKHSDRQRDRYYERDRERGRDRALDRNKDRLSERDRTAFRSQDPNKLERPSTNRDTETDRYRGTSRLKEPQVPETIRRPSHYERTTEKSATIPTTSTTTTATTTTEPPIHQTTTARRPEILEEIIERRPGRPTSSPKPENPLQQYSRPPYSLELEAVTPKDLPPKFWKPIPRPETILEKEELVDDYVAEYYDELEESVPPAASPPSNIRVVKRPFLPSRGGNPNPRGLLPVGSKATPSPRREEYKTPDKVTKLQDDAQSIYRDTSKPKQRIPEYYQGQKEGGYYQDDKERLQQYQDTKEQIEEKKLYDAYKVIQSDLHKQQSEDVLNKPIVRRPEPVEPPRRRPEVSEKIAPNWHGDYRAHEQNNEANGQGLPLTSAAAPFRGVHRHQQADKNLYSSSYKNDEASKQRLNEVARKLQEIPESEYDVTLNEALTPSLHHETNLPSGFTLPVHRQLSRDTILQSSENNYKFSRPSSQQQTQTQQQKQQKPFVPSQQFIPSPAITRNENDRSKTVYYRTPETVQISGTQYRQQRGPWQDYTGF